MNMQAMMQQAQKLQKEITKVKEEIENKEYSVSKSFVEIIINGKKELKKIKIEKDSLDKEDIEILEDLIMVSINEATAKVDEEMNQKLGKYGMGSLGF